MTLRLVFLGPPGAGKGTIAQRLAESHGLVQISTGDLLRGEAKKDTPLGKRVKQTIEAGELVKDETVAELVEGKLKELGKEKGFILDGFPRTRKQAGLLENVLERQGMNLDAAIDVEAGDETIIERLSSRVQCSECGRVYNLKNLPPEEEGKCDECGGRLVHREDDRPAVVKMRLETYRKKTAPLVEYYQKKGLLKKVDANGTLQQNMRSVERALKEIE